MLHHSERYTVPGGYPRYYIIIITIPEKFPPQEHNHPPEFLNNIPGGDFVFLPDMY